MPQTYDTDIELRFSDFDLYGHVNSVQYLTYCETARIKLLGEALKTLADSRIHVVVAHAECKYLAPILYGEKVMVSTHASRIGNTSFDLEYRVGDGDSKTYAAARTTMVCFDSERKEAVSVPEKVRKILVNP